MSKANAPNKPNAPNVPNVEIASSRKGAPRNDSGDVLDTIRVQLAAAKVHLDDVRAEMGTLAALGMWPAAAAEQWQERNGSGAYLYMIFRQDPKRAGRYLGPEGKRKVYVGCGKVEIAEARRKAKNRERFDELDAHAHALEQWIKNTEWELQKFAVMCKAWPRRKLDGARQLELLGR